MVQQIEDLLGAHISTSGGIHTAPLRAAEIGSQWTQIFTKAPQQWAEPVFGDAERDAYQSACAAQEIVGTTVHASYLINAASPKIPLYEKSVQSLTAEYKRCVTIGAQQLVVHPGAATDGDREAGLIRNADAVVRVLRAVEGETTLCLEITSGKGTVLGHTFNELAIMLERILEQDPSLAGRIGVCLDTCHMFASGYNLPDEYDVVMRHLDTTIGIEWVRCVHLNGSEGRLGSTTDRHTWIGQGQDGIEGFRRLMQDPRFASVPMLLETPKGDDPVASDRRNLALLRSLRGVSAAEAVRLATSA